MATFYYPIEVMQLRDQRLQSSHGATFGLVRNNQTRNHQGWDLYAPVGTRCYAIASGHVEWVKNEGGYGLQVAISFNRDGSTGASVNPLIAFYAHLSPGSVVVRPGDFVHAGQYIAQTGVSGNANGNAPHLHFEIRTTSAASVGGGLANRLDPGEILGYRLYTSERVQIGGQDLQRQMSIVRGAATPILH
jgi:murein DD-endopeptidase MepM/ murein hydrolase activator NlpD